MNSNQIKGTIKDAAGKVQRKTGETTGSATQQIKGAARQVAGKAQKALGDVQQAARDSTAPQRKP